MWLPLDGKAVHSKKFFNDIYKHNKWYNEYPDLEDRADDEFWWRNNRKYFHIWGADKQKRGNVIFDHNHLAEWYDLDKQLLDAEFTVLGEQRGWQDLCAYDYDTNAYNTDQAVNDEYDGSYWFQGYNDGWLAGLGGASTLGVERGFWSSVFVDVENGNIDPTWWYLHSQFLAQTAGPGVYALVEGHPSASSPGTDQAGFNTNCRLVLGGQAAANVALNSLLTNFWDTNVWDDDQKTMFCGQNVFYATIKDGGYVYQMTCSLLDIAFCVQEDVAEYFGTLFAAPLTAAAYPGGMYENQTVRAMWEPDYAGSQAEFLGALGLCPILPYILESAGQKYIRTSKYVAFPVELARRLQILDGNCTLNHPSVEQTETAWINAYNDSETLDIVQNQVPGALAILQTCQAFSTNAVQCQTSQASGGTDGCAETGANVGTLATLSGGTVTDSATAGAFCTTQADGTIEGSSLAIVTAATTAVGANIFQFFLLDYRSKMWYECPDFDDESIRVAKDLRETVVDRYREIIDDFNQDSVYMEISILSDKTEKEGYDNMFDTNVSFMIVSICIMIVFVIGANYKNILIASLSMVLTFMCIIAVFGFTIQPYTPSMIQFLPYLLLGIGVDDLFVILSHYNDEGTVPKTIHHAGQAITCTSMTNACVFLTLYLLAQVPDVQQFTFAAMLGVLFLYVNVFCGILPVITFVKWCKGEEDSETEAETDLSVLGESSLKTYNWLKEKVDKVRHIAFPIVIVLIWITLTVLAFGKIEGFVGDKMALGLQMSELVEEDEGDHLYRSLKVFEDFPFYGIDCGSGNEHGTSDFLGHVFDDDWPRLKAFFNALSAIQYTSITSTSWANAITETDPQPYPYYTNQAQQPLPAYWNNWYDQDHILEPTNLTVPLASFVVVTPDAEGRDLVEVIKDMYDVIDDFEDIGAWCNSVTLQVFERYIGVKQIMYFSLGITVAIIFLVALILVGDVGAAVVMSLVCALTAFQLWGWFGFAGLRINNVLTLNIMLGAAFMVQYTAHLAHRFVISKAPTRWHRVIDAISVYGWPIVLGAASTAIAVSVAAFYPIKYFNLYFFRAFMLVVGFGLWNGFFVQSALLILIPVWSSWGVPMGVFGEDNDTKEGTLTRRYSSSTIGDGIDIELPGIQTIQSDSKADNL